MSQNISAVLQALETFSAFLSIVGCSTILIQFWIKKCHNTISNKLLLYLQFLQLCLAIAYGIGVAGIINPGFCKFQALIIQWFGLASVLWVTNMSLQLYRWIVLKKKQEQLTKNLYKHFIGIVTITGILAFVLLGIGAYDDAVTWCWISKASEYEPYRFYCFYLILIVAWFFMILMLYRVSKYLRSSVENNMRSSNVETGLQSSENTIQKKLALYVFVFILSWFFGLLNRFVGYVNGNPVDATSILMAFFLPLQGFLNAICFGNFLEIVRTNLFSSEGLKGVITRKLSRHRNSRLDEEDMIINDLTCALITNSDGTAIPPPLPQHKPDKYSPKKYSIFISTFNLGEASLQDISNEMVDWILPHQDVYVIGLQECIDLGGLRTLILNEIGGPSEFTMFTSEIGSGNTQLGYHGFIALTVYIKNSEIEAGNISPTISSAGNMATGTNLIVTTAQNKGAVGLPFQIHDTTLGFVSCHLPSDSKGASKLSKRNESAQSILRELNLSPENLGFDLHHQLDHTIILGDLNYRMDTKNSAEGITSLTNVAIACSVEKDYLDGDSSWLKRKYNLLRTAADPVHPSKAEIRKHMEARTSSRAGWAAVLCSDELRMIIEDGDAFAGFDEPLPCFPPSYKRRKGSKGSCGDYTELKSLVSGYSNLGKENDVKLLLQHQYEKKALQETRKEQRASISSSAKITEASNDNSSKSFGDLSDNDDVTSPNKKKSIQLQRMKPGSDELAKGTLQEHNKNSIVGVRLSGISGIEEGRAAASSSLSSSERAAKAKSIMKRAKSIDEEMSKEDVKKFRPPSYTDRILIHSLKDRKSRLAVQAYDFCDTMKVSDHRPVSMTVILEVNSSVRFPDNACENYPGVREGVSVEVVELTILDLQVYLGLTEDDTEAEDGSDLPTIDESEDDADDDDDDDDNDEDGDKFEVGSELPLTKQQQSSSSQLVVDMMRKSNSSEENKSPFWDETFRPNTNVNANTSASAPPASATTTVQVNAHTNTVDTTINILASRASFTDEASTSFKGFPSRARRVSAMPVARRGSVLNRPEMMTIFDQIDLPELSEEEATNDQTTLSPLVRNSMESSSRPNSSNVIINMETLQQARASTTAIIEERPSEGIPQVLEQDERIAEKGAWRKKVEQEEMIRKMVAKADRAYIVKKRLTKLKQKLHFRSKKKDDNRIANVTIVFPIPSKDPLITHRKISDIATAMQVDSSQLLSNFKDIAGSCMTADNVIPTSTSTGDSPAGEPPKISILSKDAFLKSSSVFEWKEVLNDIEKPLQQTVNMKLSGVISPELGAHALMKFTNKTGYVLGECVVCLSHLLNPNPTYINTSKFDQIQLSSGGQIRGFVNGTFAVRVLRDHKSRDSHV